MSDKLCMGCMNALPDDAETCPVCGYPAGGENPSQYLPVNTLLSDRYLVGRVLDVGGDSVRYLGYDRELRSPIMIREFFPGTLCERGENHAVLVLGGCELPFREYLDKFRRHVRALARMRELPAMIPIYDIFEENDTVYAVSEPEEGVTLESRLAEIGGRMRWADARPLFMPLLSSLISLHSAGIYHLGLCPQNLLIAPDGKLRLRGFYLPEARFASTEITPSLPDGYAAPEQYGFDTDITAATDVYGFVATLFRTLSGVVPPVGSKRAANSGDLFLSADVARELPDQVAAVLFNGLQVNAAARIPSLTVLEDQLATAPAVTALLQDEPEELPVKPAKKDKSAKNKTPLIIIGVVFALLVLIGGGVLFWILSGSLDEVEDSTPSSSEDSSLSTEDTFAIPSLIGENFFEVRTGVFNGNMKVEVDYMKYSKKKRGTILSQSPDPDSQLPAESTIKVVISAGQEDIKIPDVAGWQADQAKDYLEALGFEVDTVKVTGSKEKRGCVDKVSPDPGSTAKEGDIITLRVSNQDPPTSTTSAPVTTTTTAAIANTAALDTTISIAETLQQTDFTEQSWTAFEAALDEARNVSVRVDVKQREVDAAVTHLNQAIRSLVRASAEPSHSTSTTD